MSYLRVNNYLTEENDVIGLGLHLSSLADSCVFGLDYYKSKKEALKEKTTRLLGEGVQLCKEIKRGISLLEEKYASLDNVDDINTYGYMFSFLDKDKIRTNVTYIEENITKVLNEENVPDETINATELKLNEISSAFLGLAYKVCGI